MMLIGLGGALGAILRFLLASKLNRDIRTFPFGTWLVNCSGSFALGYFAQMNELYEFPEWVSHFIAMGFLGSFTTFSTFGYETIQLIQANKIRHACIYVITSVFVALTFVFLGMYLANVLR